MSYGGKHRYGPNVLVVGPDDLGKIQGQEADVFWIDDEVDTKMELGRWQGIRFHHSEEVDLGDQALDGQIRPWRADDQHDGTTRRRPPDDQMARWAMKLLEPNPTFAKVAAWVFGVLLALIAADVLFLVLRK